MNDYPAYQSLLQCADQVSGPGSLPFQKYSKQVNRWILFFFLLLRQPYLLNHYNLKLPDVYVGIIGWIYRTKIDPISVLHPYPCFLTFSSNGHPYIFFFISRNVSPLIHVIIQIVVFVNIFFKTTKFVPTEITLYGYVAVPSRSQILDTLISGHILNFGSLLLVAMVWKFGVEIVYHRTNDRSFIKCKISLLIFCDCIP